MSSRRRCLPRSVLVVIAAIAARPALAAAQQRALPAVAPQLARLVPPVPTPSSFIADVPRTLAPAAHASLDARIRALQDSGLGDIGVALLPSIADYAPVDVGVAIYRTWRIGRVDSIGSARRDLGALLLIVPKELAPDHKGQCWITTGTGAEGALTDAASAAICRDSIIPHLRTRDYAGAIGAGISGIAERLRRDPALATPGKNPVPLPAKPSHRTPWLVGVLGAVAAALAGIGGFLWSRFRPRSCPTCGHRMSRLDEQADDAALNTGQRLEEKLHSVNYDVWRCPAGHESIVPHRTLFTRYRVCPTCGVRAEFTIRRVIRSATYTATGLAEDTHRCKACGATRTEQAVLPVLQRSSGSSGSGSGGGGGGSSFGGSGSTSGGGGGSSY